MGLPWLISERLSRGPSPRAVGICVGFWFAHEIVGHIVPDLEKEIVILSMNRKIHNEESSLVGNAAPMSANSCHGYALRASASEAVEILEAASCGLP